MRRTAIMGPVLVGLFLVGLIVTSVAAANKPEFEREATFTSLVLNTIFKTAVFGMEVKCTGGGIEKGEIVALKTKVAKAIQLNFTGCKSGAFECKTAGAAAGEIRSEKLEGELGYLLGSAEGAETVAFALKPASVALIATFTCNGVLWEEKGCVAGKIKKANVLTTSWSLTFEEKSGEQAVKDYEPTQGTVKTCELMVKIGNIELQNGIEDTHTITLGTADKIIS